MSQKRRRVVIRRNGETTSRIKVAGSKASNKLVQKGKNVALLPYC